VDHPHIPDGVIAALIGATTTMVATFIQLIVNARKQTAESRGKRKTPWLLIFALMLACAVGGFGYSEYRNWTHEDKTDQLRAEVTKLTQLAALNVQPKVVADGNPLAGSAIPLPSASAATPGPEQVRDAIITLPACKGLQVGFGAERAKCSETDALRATVCVPVPANAQIRSVELFARAEDSQQPWADARVTPQAPVSNGRLDERYAERAEADGGRQICQAIAHWDSEKGRSVRVLVRFGS
jgi:hypothetical protein